MPSVLQVPERMGLSRQVMNTVPNRGRQRLRERQHREAEAADRQQLAIRTFQPGVPVLGTCRSALIGFGNCRQLVSGKAIFPSELRQ